MSFFDKIKDKFIPEPSNAPISTSPSGGIGNRRGTLGFEDDVSYLFPVRSAHPVVLGCASRRNRRYFDRFEPTLRNHVRSLEHLSMNINSEGYLVFILFIPILWLWLWVHAFAAR